MSLQTSHSSKHITSGTHVQQVIFSRDPTSSRHISARARIGSPGGEGARIDAASTTAKPFFNGDSRRSSEAKLQEGHAGARHSETCAQEKDSRTLPFSSAEPEDSRARTALGTARVIVTDRWPCPQAQPIGKGVRRTTRQRAGPRTISADRHARGSFQVPT